jgi:hypothetical protein
MRFPDWLKASVIYGDRPQKSLARVVASGYQLAVVQDRHFHSLLSQIFHFSQHHRVHRAPSGVRPVLMTIFSHRQKT